MHGHKFWLAGLLLAASATLASGQAYYQEAPPAVAIAGPAPLPSEFVRRPRTASTQYSIGNPSANEQYLLELLNRARAGANAEATRLAAITDTDVVGAIKFFGVNLTTMKSQFAALPQNEPPLAFNSMLMASSGNHSQQMLSGNFQGHGDIKNDPQGDSAAIAGRIHAAGYMYSTAAENVFAYGKSLIYIHAGFEIDWGSNPPSGMQNPAGHRLNDHDVNATTPPGFFREVGIRVLAGPGDGNNLTPVGPMVVTYDLGTQQTNTTLITGVVYKDKNANKFYDPGEGVGSVRVDVTGSDYFALTASSGGYAVPVPSDGNYTVTFSGSGITTVIKNITVSGGKNVKVDDVIATPIGKPTISKQPTALTVKAGVAAIFQFSASGTGLSYQWFFGTKALANDSKHTGAFTNKLTVKKAAKADVGSYSCKVSNSAGAVTTAKVKLTVK